MLLVCGTKAQSGGEGRERGEGRGEGERRWDERKWERESGWPAATYQMLSRLGILMTFLFAQKFQLSLEHKCISGFTAVINHTRPSAQKRLDKT